MAQQPVDIGESANDGTGDTLRVAFAKLNANDEELYSLAGGGGGSPDTPAQILAKLITVDGVGSGLDADLLDGQSSAAFAQAVHTHAQADVTGLTAALAAKLDASSYTAADVRTKLLTVDGAGSGIDADLLDGLSSAAFATAVHTHAIGDVTGLQAALDGKGDLSSAVSVSVDSEVMLYSGTTGKLAKRAAGSGLATLAAGVLTLTDPATFATAAHTHAIADTTGLQAALDAKLASADYTAADVLAKLLTVDGAGSGIDADLLDGQSSAAFAAAAHAHVIADVTGLQGALDAKLDASSYTAADVLAKLITVDGAGSGVDADLLDGISSAGYLQTSTYQALTPVWTNSHTFSAAAYHGITVAEVAGITGLLQAPTMLYAATRQVTVRAAGSATHRLVRVNTSFAAPSAILNAESVGSFECGGYDGSTIQGSATRLEATALENWTGSVRGCSLSIFATPAGTTTLTEGLRVGGTTTVAVQFANGTASQPAMGFIAATGTGIYRTGGGSLGLAVAGVLTGAFNANGQNTCLDGTVSLPSFSLINDPDTGLYRISANVLGVTCGATMVFSIATAQVQIVTTTIRFDTTTATTVGAAGGASALPATPLGYLSVSIAGTAAKIPYYTA
jgi:hypothetical protein